MPLPFWKPKQDRNLDVDAAVRKLKSLYSEYAEKYGEKQFNLRGFEDRYRDALVQKLNLAAFLHAEITVFEELKKRVEKGPEEKTGPTYSDIADRIIEENLERIRRYRLIDFHPDAEEETKHLLGAVTDFYYDVWGKASAILKPLGFAEASGKLENDFSYFVVPIRSTYSRAVDDYLFILSKKTPKDSEKASVNFLKYGGILLNNCLRLINDGINSEGNRVSEKDAVEELTSYRKRLQRMIEDFRLNDIRGY